MFGTRVSDGANHLARHEGALTLSKPTAKRGAVFGRRYDRMPQHPTILNSTRRSSESPASSVPVPMMFSCDPTPLVFVRASNSAAPGSAPSFCRMNADLDAESLSL